nr:uncharacterized mitochondrial protein AtMg00810-like [Tanacetum cinerariifolium]
TYHVTFDESTEAIRFTNTLVDEIRIDDSSRYPLEEFIHKDDPSRLYQLNSDISYYVIPQGCSLVELSYEKHVPKVIALNEHETPHTQDVEGPPDLISNEGTHEQNVQNEEIITQPTKGPTRNNTKVSVSIIESLVPDVPQSQISHQANINSHPPPHDRWSKEQHIELFKKLMTKKFEMSMIGELTYFLGLQIKQDDNEISISQEHYTRILLKKYEISDSFSVKTPMVPPNNLGLNLAGKPVNETSYRGMVGSLMYLTARRCDIQFSIVLCTRYQSNPKESHLIAVKRILRYLKGTLTLGLYYLKRLGFNLKGYSNSDYVGCNMDKKAPQVPIKYLVENWFVGVLRNSSQWLCPSSPALQDDLILSVIEQLKTKVVNYTKIKQDNKNINEILTAELERYKNQERILKEQNNIDKASVSYEQSLEIEKLKHTLPEHLKEKESLEQKINYVNASLKSKSVKKPVNRKFWQPTRKMFTTVGHIWRPTGRNFTLVGNVCPLTRITTTAIVPLREPIPKERNTDKPVVTLVYSRKSKAAKKKVLDLLRGRTRAQSILDGKFCDSDVEVAFRQHTCFIRNLDGVDLLTSSRGNNLYTLYLQDMMASLPICLLSMVSKTMSWLWHRRLSHLNFGAINHLARQGLVRGLPKLKFEKYHLYSACAMGKSTKKSHKPKFEGTNQEKLYLLHMDHCGPMHVESINGKKYILVIVDDYSRFTWVKFLRSKDEALDFIIKFLKMIQIRLNVPVRQAVATACYTQNRSIIRLRHGKTPHLEYAFLGNNEEWPVIIVKDLSSNKKIDLINVLKTRKKAIAWKLTDIKGIDPNFVRTRFYLKKNTPQKYNLREGLIRKSMTLSKRKLK